MVKHIVQPAWEPTITELRNHGLPAVLTTYMPGLWDIVVHSEDPADFVEIGTLNGPQIDDTFDVACVDPHDGPTGHWVSYRYLRDGDDQWTTTERVANSVDELVTTVRDLFALTVGDEGTRKV